MFLNKSPAHPKPLARFNQATVLFVTMCTKPRGNWLATPETQHALLEAAHKANHWSIGRYVIMPDHVHFFCKPGVIEPASIKKWSSYLKRNLTLLLETQGNWSWQSDVWDTQMRDRNHYTKKLHYMEMNPVRAGLVDDPALWPYKGSVRDLVWL